MDSSDLSDLRSMSREALARLEELAALVREHETCPYRARHRELMAWLRRDAGGWWKEGREPWT